MQASSYQTSLRILQPDRERSGSVSEDSHLTDGSVSSASHAQAELHESRRQSVEGCSTLAKQHRARTSADRRRARSEEHTSELQSLRHLVCRLLLEKKKKKWH